MNNFAIASIISFVFLIVKFIEMRFIDKENKPIKFLIRDSLLVYFSVISGLFIMEQVGPMMVDISDSPGKSAIAFTDKPGF